MTKTKKKNARPPSQTLPKALTGIQGLDEITGGGLPSRTSHARQRRRRFRKDAVRTGVPGSGRHAIRRTRRVHVVRGNDPGPDEERRVARLRPGPAGGGEEAVPGPRVHLAQRDCGNRRVRSRWSLHSHCRRRPAGRARSASSSTRIEALFGELPNPGILRAEIRRLFGWLKEKGLTTVITAERDRPDKLTRHGIEEFVSDCVIVLDHRIREEISTRRLRIVKYRGSTHGTNEYPFLIDEHGISVLPISSLGLDHAAPAARISTGIARLDGMMGGKGFYRGSSILMSGTSGTGKTSVAAHFVDAACRRGERCLYFAFEESPKQIVRNMRSIGIDLEPWVRKGLLQFHAARPTYGGHRRSPAGDAQTHLQLQAQRRRGGPDYQSAHGQHAERSAVHAHAAGRFSEDPGDHGDLHQSDRGRRRPWKPARRTSLRSWTPGSC